MANNNREEYKSIIAEVLGEACLNAVQALRQSTAAIELMIAKGVVTPAEVDEQMRLTEHLSKNLQDVSDRILKTVGDVDLDSE